MICVSDIRLPEEFFSPGCDTNFAPTMGDLLREHFEVDDMKAFCHTPPRPLDALDFCISKVSYRPFDEKYVYWTGRAGLISHPRVATMRHLQPWWWEWGTRPMLKKVGTMTRGRLDEFLDEVQDDFFNAPVALVSVCFLSALRCGQYERQLRDAGLKNEPARQGYLFAQ